MSYEWLGQNGSGDEGHVHERVFHKRNYLNPITEFHTQAIERACVDAKVVIKRNYDAMKGTICKQQIYQLQAVLDECFWGRSKRDSNNLFSSFLTEMSALSSNN